MPITFLRHQLKSKPFIHQQPPRNRNTVHTMVKKIYSTSSAAPKTSGPTEHSANLKFLEATVLQDVQKVLAIFDYLYNVPLVPITELSTKDICIICKGNTDIGFPIGETARSRVRLTECGDILCLGCLSCSAFSSRGDQCPHCQRKLLQDGQETCCDDDDTVNLVRFVEYLRSIGPQTAKAATHHIFATAHSANSHDSRKSAVLGAYWMSVEGNAPGGGMDRVKFRRKIRYSVLSAVVVSCIGLALLGILMPFSKGKYSRAIVVILMYIFGIRFVLGALKVWGILFHMSQLARRS